MWYFSEIYHNYTDNRMISSIAVVNLICVNYFFYHMSLFNTIYVRKTASVVKWSESLTTAPEVPGVTSFSEQ
jgi:hypothetical protein